MPELRKITEKIYIFSPGENDRPIFALIQGDKNSLIIDTGNSPSHANLFQNAIKDINIGNVFIVLTHWHWDHIFGACEFNYPIISSQLTYEQILLIKKMKWDKKSINCRVINKLEHPFCSIS